MMTPKERDELVLSYLGPLLNKQGFGFKISKTVLTWKNEHVTVRVKPRGSRYSTAQCSIRWMDVRVESHALRKAYRAGAPIKGTLSGPPEQLISTDVQNTSKGWTVQLELTNQKSCELGAHETATHFLAFWEQILEPWLDPAHTIDYLSKSDKLMRVDVLIGLDASVFDSSELQSIIDDRVESTAYRGGSISGITTLAELLLATNRIDDLKRIILFVNAYANSIRPRAKSMPRLNQIANWLDVR